MKSFLLAGVLIFLALSAFSWQTKDAAVQASTETDDLKPLPTLRLTDFDGKTVTPEEFNGKVYIVDFWATWCGPCIVEIPAFNRLQEKYADKGLRILGVTMASGEANEIKPLLAKGFTVGKERHKMKYTVLMGDDEQAYDLQIMGFPTTYVVTKDWKIYKKYMGLSSKKSEMMEADIQHLLDLKP